MKEATFEELYSKEWQEFEELLSLLEKHAPKKRKDQLATVQYRHFISRYRRLCHYFSMSKERGYSSYQIQYLNNLVTRGHAILYHHKPTRLIQVMRFFLYQFPSLVRKEIKWVGIAFLLFFVPLLLMGTATFAFPELAYSVFSQQQVQSYESMYDSTNSIRESRRSQDDFAMFGFYILNNIGIGFRTFASGLLFGLGSIFFLVFNGIVIGTVAGHMSDPAYSTVFYSFVIGHGSFELTAIVLSGAAGLKLGASLLSPGRRKRIDALKLSAAICVRLVYGIIAMLVIAAFIEAFWSSSVVITYNTKFIAGSILWLIVIAYFVLLGRSDGYKQY